MLVYSLDIGILICKMIDLIVLAEEFGGGHVNEILPYWANRTRG